MVIINLHVCYFNDKDKLEIKSKVHLRNVVVRSVSHAHVGEEIHSYTRVIRFKILQSGQNIARSSFYVGYEGNKKFCKE